MTLIESILTKNPCYTAGRKITVKGLMLHSVGCPQPSAEIFVRNWNSTAHNNSCVHGFIDGNTGKVFQTLPWDHRGWHCGSGGKGSGNNTHIGVEMCEPACIRYTTGSNFTCSDVATAKAVVKRTYDAAVELFAMLCGKFHLDPLGDGVIVSHKEGNVRGIASNHGDPEHLWTQLDMGYTMDGFRRDVAAAMGNAVAEPSDRFTPYKVRVKIDDLCIRKGAGTNYQKNGFTGKGVFTIVEEADGQINSKGKIGKWGLLKSRQKERDAWICLAFDAYTEKV